MVSAIPLLGAIGVFGLGTMLIGQLSLSPARVDPLLPAALGISVVLSGSLSVVFALVVALMPNMGLHKAFGNHWSAYVLFIVGVAATSSAAVLDQASLGLGAGPIQLLRNTVMCGVRILAVIALAILSSRSADNVLIVWAGALIFSIAVVAWPMRRRGIRFMRLRSPRNLGGLVMHTAHHNTLNMSLGIPRLIMPTIVAVYAAGTPTAVFYVCWMVAGFLYIVPTHLSTTLFAVTAGDAETLRRKVRVTLTISVAVGCVGLPAVALLAHPLLSVFGPKYADLGSQTLAILTLLYIPNAIKDHYAAVSRVRGDVRFAGAVCTVAAVAEIAAFAAAMRSGRGIEGAAVVLCIVLYVEGLFMLPALIAALHRARRHMGQRLATSSPTVPAAITSSIAPPGPNLTN
jgi:hypothetical protein